MIGTNLGRYRILEALGEGGMGRVFVAEDPTLARRVAIKVLPPAFSADPNLRQRLLLEARAASALNHPNILTIHDLGEEGGILYVAMELIDGQTLRAWSGGRAVPAAELLPLVRQATRALATAHAAGLVHRDLKPENLMVRRDGLLKILDFGLARSVSPEHDKATMAHTMPGTILGTAPYMSPEQVLGKPAGAPSDVFSLGTLLYELLTGTHPFATATAVDTMHRILHDVPAAPSKLTAGIPPELDFIVLKTLAKDPARRYASARELDVDLETCEAGLGRTAKELPAGGAAGKEGAVGPRAIAVLPFRNLGGNPELNHLGLGLADAVINRLSSSPDLVVRATSTIGRYEHQLVEVAQVARELDVVAVLDASFQRAGDRFRATARLVDAEGRALWAGKVDLDFADVFEVQDQVASGIATALTARLAAGQPAAGGGGRDPRAFDLYMRALKAHSEGTRSGFLSAIGHLQEATGIDPGYVDAWVLLAGANHAMFDSGSDSDPIWLKRSVAANVRARALDPQHPGALAQAGASHLVAGEKSEAYRALAEAHRRLPNDWLILHYLGYLFRLCNMVEAFEAAEGQSIALDPSPPWSYWSLQRVALERDRLDEARRWTEGSHLRFPTHPGQTIRELALWFHEGRDEDVLRTIAEKGDALEGHAGPGILQAMALARLGRREEARGKLVTIDAACRLDMDFAAYAAVIEGLLGDAEAAFRWLDRAIELGNDAVYLYENPKLFGPLHGDPRWAGFIAGVKRRAESFQKEFHWPIPA
ncbi:MAG: serine/threonine-protein kinase [Candidatus Eisenbacteria bacterium]